MGGGHNPIPRWFTAFFFLAMAAVVIIAANDPHTSNVYAQDGKKDAPKDKDSPKEAPKKLEIELSKVVVVTVKGNDFIIHSTLPIEAVESRYLKSKPKTEVLKEGGILVRNETPYILRDSGDSKIYLCQGGVKIKYCEVRVPSGMYVVFK